MARSAPRDTCFRNYCVEHPLICIRDGERCMNSTGSCGGATSGMSSWPLLQVGRSQCRCPRTSALHNAVSTASFVRVPSPRGKGPCPTGYFCPTQTEAHICPRGQHCPGVGNTKPVDCYPAYNPDLGRSIVLFVPQVIFARVGAAPRLKCALQVLFVQIWACQRRWCCAQLATTAMRVHSRSIQLIPRPCVQNHVRLVHSVWQVLPTQLQLIGYRRDRKVPRRHRRAQREHFAGCKPDSVWLRPLFP